MVRLGFVEGYFRGRTMPGQCVLIVEDECLIAMMIEDMVLDLDQRAVRDGINVLSSEGFDACLAIVVCRMGPTSMRTSRRWRGITG